MRGRSPHGERGLKQGLYGAEEMGDESLPAWGAWVETIKALHLAQN